MNANVYTRTKDNRYSTASKLTCALVVNIQFLRLTALNHSKQDNALCKFAKARSMVQQHNRCSHNNSKVLRHNWSILEIDLVSNYSIRNSACTAITDTVKHNCKHNQLFSKCMYPCWQKYLKFHRMYKNYLSLKISVYRFSVTPCIVYSRKFQSSDMYDSTIRYDRRV